MAEPVILIHGLLMRSPAMLLLAARLRNQGFAPELFGYGTLWGEPGRAMERLAMHMYGMGPGPVHLVGHSLGGLIALETLNQYQRLPAGRVVCLGSPLQGSGAARGLARQGLSLLAGRSGRLLRAGLGQLPPGREVGVVAGDRAMGLGRLFGRFEGPSDGTVEVWETRLPGLADHTVVATSHSGMVFSAPVANLVARFLTHGRFA